MTVEKKVIKIVLVSFVIACGLAIIVVKLTAPDTSNAELVKAIGITFCVICAATPISFFIARINKD